MRNSIAVSLALATGLVVAYLTVRPLDGVETGKDLGFALLEFGLVGLVCSVVAWGVMRVFGGAGAA